MRQSKPVPRWQVYVTVALSVVILVLLAACGNEPTAPTKEPCVLYFNYGDRVYISADSSRVLNEKCSVLIWRLLPSSEKP